MIGLPNLATSPNDGDQPTNPRRLKSRPPYPGGTLRHERTSAESPPRPGTPALTGDRLRCIPLAGNPRGRFVSDMERAGHPTGRKCGRGINVPFADPEPSLAHHGFNSSTRGFWGTNGGVSSSHCFTRPRIQRRNGDSAETHRHIIITRIDEHKRGSADGARRGSDDYRRENFDAILPTAPTKSPTDQIAAPERRCRSVTSRA